MGRLRGGVLKRVRKTILVVEDHEPIREMMVQLFQHQGYGALEARSGNEALAILSTCSVDFIVSDIEMPDGDGFSLLRELRKIGTIAPPLIFVSGREDISVGDAKARGAVSILRKPVDAGDLLSRIEAILKHS
jgi:two-component system KDP operon response regulator KdpE